MNEKPAETRQLDDTSWWFRFRYTPVSDAIHGAITARLSVAYAVDAANLPAPLPQTIMAVVRRTKLWHRERLEVARELISHFQDGLDSGSSPNELGQAFGDVKQAAALIRRAKKRNRPLWWRTGRRTVQGVVLLPVVLILLYLPIAARFFIGSPTITHDYVADLNKAAAAVPADQRAWPVYREALIGLPSPYLIVKRDNAPDPLAVKPGDPDWPAFEAFVEDHADRLALIRKAAAMPGLGYISSARIAEEDLTLWPESRAAEDKSEGSVIGVLLPHLAEMTKMRAVVALDLRRAVAEGDSIAIIADFAALVGMARHARESGTIIGDLVSLAVFQMSFDRLAEILHRQPELLTDDQWMELAHRLAAVGDDDVRVRVGSERYMFYDVVQRIYTDNGNGDGRITWKGMMLLDQVTSMRDAWGLESEPLQVALSPAMGLLVVSRREALNEYERIIGEMERNGDLPLWQRQRDIAGSLLGKWQASPIDGVRWLPLVRLLPAVEQASLRHEAVRASRDAVLAAIALELHRRRHGVWPVSLDELVPSLLPALLVDRFNGQPLRYRIIDGTPTLYSVGVNLIDDGGARAYHKMTGDLNLDRFPQRYSDNTGDWVLWPPRDDTKD